MTRRPEVDGHRHADCDLGWIDIDQIRQHPDTLVEIDQGGQDWVLERRVLWVMKDGVAVDDAIPGQIDDLELQRVALRAHWPRRMSQPATILASLRDEATVACGVPVEVVVIVEERGGPGDLACLTHVAPSKTARPSTIALTWAPE
jgi:hypothetical protein